MIDLESALQLPTRDSSWTRKVLIGGLLNLVPIINFLSLGYAYRLFRNTLQGELFSLPEWEDWGDLFVQGFVVFLIGLLYNLPSLILLAIHPLLGILAFIAAALLLPMALARYAVGGNFSQAFQLGDIWGEIQKIKGDYYIAWLVTVAISIVLLMIFMIPVLGWIISAIVGFYAYLIYAGLFGEICAK